MKTIEVQQLAEAIRRGPVDLIDVRMPSEFREVHAECARCVPLESLDPKQVLADRNAAASQPLYVICRSGNRSAQACRKLIEAGIENVVNVSGGTLAWVKADLPVVRGPKSLPLSQQVQLTAGFLTLLGAGLAYYGHPYFVALSAFIGGGLMFAGATGICPLASTIARMPWNQGTGRGSCTL